MDKNNMYQIVLRTIKRVLNIENLVHENKT